MFLNRFFSQTIWYIYTAVYFCQLCGLSHLHPLPWRRLQLYQPRTGEWQWKRLGRCNGWTVVFLSILFLHHYTLLPVKSDNAELWDFKGAVMDQKSHNGQKMCVFCSRISVRWADCYTVCNLFITCNIRNQLTQSNMFIVDVKCVSCSTHKAQPRKPILKDLVEVELLGIVIFGATAFWYNFIFMYMWLKPGVLVTHGCWHSLMRML